MQTFTESTAAAGGPDMRRRQILIVANETVESDVLERAVRSNVQAADRARVLVVTPALNSRIRHWTSDDDRAHELAEERLCGCLERLGKAGIDANGIIGDADPLIAIGDALRVFRADELIVATHPEGRSNWLARNVVARAQFRFGLPVIHVVVDRPGRAEYVVRSRSPSVARLRRVRSTHGDGDRSLRPLRRPR